MMNIKVNDIPGVPRLQEVGGGARRGGGAARPQHDARPALLPQLRPDLVWVHEAGRRPLQSQVISTLPRPHQSPRATLKLRVSKNKKCFYNFSRNISKKDTVQ